MNQDEYSVEKLAITFAEHAIESEKRKKECIEMFTQNSPGEPIPQHMTTEFNICLAFQSICNEIVKLKEQNEVEK